MPVAIVPDGLDGVRADVGASRLFGFSRSIVEQAADGGSLLVNSVVVPKSARLHAGSMIEINLGKRKTIDVAPSLVMGMEIIYDDEDIVVVNKPAGVAAHPSLGWDGGSVVGHLAAAGFHISTSGPPERQGIVSRLDVGTSGLMVVAKSERAYSVLKAAFRDREVTKVYHALVQGYPDPPEGIINVPIAHAKTDEWKMATDPTGRPSVTTYSTKEVFSRATLLDVRPKTGRTHQIRVHMAAIRHQCVGDLTYGADPSLAAKLHLDHQWLHAAELGFRHPTKPEDMWFTASYPPDLAEALQIVSMW